MSAEKKRVVIDTQLFLRATVNRQGLTGRIIFEWRDKYHLLITDGILAEINDVLDRPELRKKFKTLTDRTVAEVMKRLSESDNIPVEDIPAVSRDTKDDIFLACALAGKADYIVTEDKDLLVLNPYEGIHIINVPEFFRLMQDE